MNARVARRLRQAVWGKAGQPKVRQYYSIKSPGTRASNWNRTVIADDTRRRYQSFKRAYNSFPWDQRHTAFQVRKSV